MSVPKYGEVEPVLEFVFRATPKIKVGSSQRDQRLPRELRNTFCVHRIRKPEGKGASLTNSKGFSSAWAPYITRESHAI